MLIPWAIQESCPTLQSDTQPIWINIDEEI